MKFDVDDKNRCRLVCVKFHLNRCRFAVAVGKCLGDSLFWGHSVHVQCTKIVIKSNKTKLLNCLNSRNFVKQRTIDYAESLPFHGLF